MSSVGLSEIEIIRANIGDIKTKNSTILFVQGKMQKKKINL